MAGATAQLRVTRVQTTPTWRCPGSLLPGPAAFGKGLWRAASLPGLLCREVDERSLQVRRRSLLLVPRESTLGGWAKQRPGPGVQSQGPRDGGGGLVQQIQPQEKKDLFFLMAMAFGIIA